MITTETSHKFQMFIFGYFATGVHNPSFIKQQKGTAKMADFGLSCVRGSKEWNCGTCSFFLWHGNC